ncbi:MAG TPA: hypothetical protein VKT29_07135 [Terriglobales bacterium]|nr:hypothetical protein [Terriglobales bacterium]
MAETRSEAGRFGQLAEIAVGQHVLCDRSGQPDATVVSAAIAPQLQDRMAEIQLRLAEAQQARMQAQLARMQQVMVRRAVERARAGIEHTQLAVFSDPGQVRVVVPRVPRVGVHVPQGPSIEVMPN